MIRDAREIQLDQEGVLLVPVADPFDLLRNKLAVARDKDLVHLDILKRFLEEEAVYEFGLEGSARNGPASARKREMSSPGVPRRGPPVRAPFYAGRDRNRGFRAFPGCDDRNGRLGRFTGIRPAGRWDGQ